MNQAQQQNNNNSNNSIQNLEQSVPDTQQIIKKALNIKSLKKNFSLDKLKQGPQITLKQLRSGDNLKTTQYQEITANIIKHTNANKPDEIVESMTFEEPSSSEQLLHQELQQNQPKKANKQYDRIESHHPTIKEENSQDESGSFYRQKKKDSFKVSLKTNRESTNGEGQGIKMNKNMSYSPSRKQLSKFIKQSNIIKKENKMDMLKIQNDLKQVIENNTQKGVSITLGNKNIKILKNNITLQDSPQRFNTKFDKIRQSVENSKEFREDQMKNKFDSTEMEDINVLSPAKQQIIRNKQQLVSIRQGLIKINKKSNLIRESRNEVSHNNDTLAEIYDLKIYDKDSNRGGNQSFRGRKYGVSPRNISNNNSHRSNKNNESQEFANESLKLPSVMNENHYLRKSLESLRQSKEDAAKMKEFHRDLNSSQRSQRSYRQQSQLPETIENEQYPIVPINRGQKIQQDSQLKHLSKVVSELLKEQLELKNKLTQQEQIISNLQQSQSQQNFHQPQQDSELRTDEQVLNGHKEQNIQRRSLKFLPKNKNLLYNTTNSNHHFMMQTQDQQANTKNIPIITISNQKQNAGLQRYLEQTSKIQSGLSSAGSYDIPNQASDFNSVSTPLSSQNGVNKQERFHNVIKIQKDKIQTAQTIKNTYQNIIVNMNQTASNSQNIQNTTNDPQSEYYHRPETRILKIKKSDRRKRYEVNASNEIGNTQDYQTQQVYSVPKIKLKQIHPPQTQSSESDSGYNFSFSGRINIPKVDIDDKQNQNPNTAQSASNHQVENSDTSQNGANNGEMPRLTSVQSNYSISSLGTQSNNHQKIGINLKKFPKDFFSPKNSRILSQIQQRQQYERNNTTPSNHIQLE
ncbi:UNKNOWN [Stylonychia lemnae]|uniref:Uncharacterized protein n=1 Tax=Stylonychia lemnae TaxID=5949 RepID=A0A078AAH1_STYLE|nr:UNKNOWN [Stylonychia lemnae]|eukprot:CDW79270.1 UNKNOWN [Stylonychia lemnae]